ncbi:MAG: hypothetical protein AAF730_00445 [Bacteroidota bacterium]
MRSLSILTLCVLGLGLFGCDTTSSDPLLPTQAIFRLTDIANENGFSLEVNGDSNLRQPDAVQSDTLALVRGRQYTGRIEFYNADGENITFALQENAEVIEVTYGVSGVPPLQITPTDTEQTYGAERNGVDLPVGLTFSVRVPEQTPAFVLGMLTVRVLEYAPNEKGASDDVSSWSQFSIPLSVGRAGPRRPSTLERVTGMSIQFSTPNTPSAQVGFSDSNGLQNGLSSPLDRTQLVVNRRYTAQLRLDGILAGEPEREITETIRNEGVWYLLDYSVSDPQSLAFQSVTELTITDTDADGAPLGLAFSFRTISQFQRESDLRIQMYAYGADATKLDELLDRRLVVDVVVPLDVR